MSKTPRRKLTALITLVFFFSVMAAFVAYKAGAFGTEFENNVQATFFPSHEAYVDSPVKDTAQPQVIMPSSKVGIGTVEPKPDTGVKKNANANSNDRPTYIYSTKSGPVFEPKRDTQPRQNQQINNANPK